VTPKCAIAAAVWLHLCSVVAAQTPDFCDVSASAVSFGPVDVRTGDESTGTVTVRCDMPTHFSLALSPGYGDYATRRMRGPSGAELEYNLYLDIAHSRVLGDGTAGTALLSGEDTKDFVIYGLIRPQQPVRAGTYSDQLMVTFTFP
jgi:spore coat protein U-like protein